MAVFRGTIESNVLDLDTNLVVILPYDRPAEIQQEPCKVLYLLHGLSDNAEAWVRYTGIERYARMYGYAVIMPEVGRSFYLDMEYGLPYFTYVSEELPAICNELFHISNRREDTFIAGLSMGGYGAMKCGLTFPERYAGIGSFSGALDLKLLSGMASELGRIQELKGALGEGLKVSEEDDLYLLAEELTGVSPDDRPEIFITCGKQDYIYDSSIHFSRHLAHLSIQHAYHEWDGTHEWGFWDTSVVRFLDFIEGTPYQI